MRTTEYREKIAGFFPNHKLLVGLAASAVFLSGCTDSSPYHEVTVASDHQTLDSIGEAECGPSFLGITILPRRNRLRTFNELDTETLHRGQKIRVPYSLCYDTGDRIKK